MNGRRGPRTARTRRRTAPDRTGEGRGPGPSGTPPLAASPLGLPLLGLPPLGDMPVGARPLAASPLGASLVGASPVGASRGRTSPGRTARRRTWRGRARPGRSAALATATAAAAAVLAAACLLGGCADSVTGARPSRISDMGPLGAPVPGAGQPGAGGAGKSAPGPRRVPLPGVGPRTRAEIPADAGEVVVVSAAGRDSTAATVTYFRRDPVTGWTADGRAWTAHGAARGWAGRHRAGDSRPPVGVFALTDARGRLPALVMKTLLRTLDPALHPVVVMGDAAALAR